MQRVFLPAKLSNLEKMFAFVREASQRQCFSEELCNKIQLACEEALVNVINYAYPGSEGDLEIITENKETCLEIVIIDAGIPFDPLSLPAPDIRAPMEERRIGGLGVFMIREIMDEVIYRRDGNHNVLKLVKYNSCCHAQAPDPAAKKESGCRWPLSFMKKEFFKKGDTLFKAGDPADRMFYIAKGAINLVEIKKVVTQGAVIGEMGIFSPFKERTASAVCEEDLEVFTMGKDEVIKFFGQDPTLAIELIQTSIKRFIENLKAETAARERIESELRVAQEIQSSMLPVVFPERKEFELFALMDPAKEVGGDFYDFFFVDEKRICFVIGDVSGKGVPAALFMAISKTLIKNEAMRGLSTDEILTRVNNIMYPDNATCQFVTVFCAILNVETGEVQYCNAGNNPPLVCDKSRCGCCDDPIENCQRAGCYNYLKVPGGFVMGVMRNTLSQNNSITLLPGETIFLYTDGVTEAMNPAQEQFTEPRLKKILRDTQQKPVTEIIHHLREEVRAFADGAPQSDDITMLAVRYKGVVSC
ncbi:MAG: SpoIIE family protein phosphatase [Candidatus Omnitrophota bacterium]